MPSPLPDLSLDVLDDSDAMQGLTSKMYRLATLSFSGMSDVAAYRAAGYGEGQTDKDAGRSAWSMIRHPKVQAKLLELRLKADQQSSLAPYLNREMVVSGILGLAMNADKDSTRLAAYIALGKTVGIDLFREVHVTERVTRTVDDVDKELREHLTRLQSTIDATAKDVTPPAAPVKPAGGRDRRRKPIA
jgi:hypothetical protein